MAPREVRPRVLLVDDHREMAEMLADGLADRGFDAATAAGGTEAIAMLEREPFDAVVTDLRMQPVDGLALLQAARALDPQRPVIVMTAYGAVDTAVESIRQGAYHYLTKPFKLDELVLFLQRALSDVALRRETATLRKAMRERFTPKGMLGRSKAMREVFERIERVADAATPVLITGETGTGKGLVAGALHTASRRAQAPFVTVNCAALPAALLESELFGHVKGAFTGATEHRAGLFAEAHGGTLFLDEIAELALPLQSKLLHVLERGVVRPVGGTKERAVDVRVLAATHRDLRARVTEGTFREDLLYRLDVVSIDLPALRARSEDLPELIAHLLVAARGRHPHSPVRRFAPDALARLHEYRWPGNVRELSHVIERAVLLGRGEEIALAELPPALVDTSARGGRLPFTGDVIPFRELQRKYASWALEQLGGNRTRTAERLGIDMKTLARWLEDDAKG